MGLDIVAIALKVGLKPAEVEGLLALLKDGDQENRALLQTTGLSKSILDDFRRHLAPYLKKSSSFTALNKEGKEALKNVSLSHYFWDYYLFEKPDEKFLAIWKRYENDFLPDKRKWDQFRATKETVWRRSELMKRRGDLLGRHILFLGDNDLTSIALTMKGEAKRVFVADIDSDVLGLIEKISNKEEWRIETFKYDARHRLPPHLRQRFDIVFTDPPYTPTGITLFLSRAIAALKPLPTSRLYFCYGQSDRARERSLAIQAIVQEMGLLIEERLVKFNRYSGAASIGSASALYINSITPQTEPKISGEFTGKMYTWERR